MPEAAQFSTALGTLVGAVDGSNRAYVFNQFQRTFLYAVPVGAAGEFVFRNGILQDSPADYSSGLGWITFSAISAGDICTLRMYQGGGPTRLYPGSGLLLPNPQFAQINLQPGRLTPVPFMLFRNGLLLTNGPDYTFSGPWITISAGQAIQPGDGLTAVISMGGSSCSTSSGSISGSVNGANRVFSLPFSPSTTLLFRNGVSLTQGSDYTQAGAVVTLVNMQVPQPGDILTAQLWISGGPAVQVTTADGGLYYETASAALAFVNGGLSTQPRDAVVAGNGVIYAIPPSLTSGAEIEAWAIDVTDTLQPTLNLPKQFTTVDGSISGVLNGGNNIFTLNTGLLITDVLVFWNGSAMVVGRDFTWTCLQNSSAGPWVTTITMMAGNYPLAADTLTAEAFLN